MSRSLMPVDTGELGPQDHVCWAYDEPDRFRSAVGEFLAAGLKRGLHVCYVADGDVAALRRDLGDLGPAVRAAVEVIPLCDRYSTGAALEPQAQVQAYAAATEEALAAGFEGLRVAVEVTPLVRTPHQLDAMARYEHLVDHYMADQPLSALCAYNQAELGQEAVTQLACMHPPGIGSSAPFRLCGSPYAAASLSGELDASSAQLFATALRRAEPQPIGGELLIEAFGLTLIDHRSLLTLAEYARERAATVVLLGALPFVSRLIDLLELAEVRVEAC